MIQTININGAKILSNVFFAPINPGLCTNGMICDDYIDFFVKHSSQDIGICYVGNVSLQKNWRSNDHTAILFANPERKWMDLSRRILENGSIPGIQLAWKPTQIQLQKGFTARNKEEQLNLFRDFYDRFNDYDYVANLFRDSIKCCIASGFPVIQLHAAHGYALSLLLSRTVSGCRDPKDTKGIKLIEKIMCNLNVNNTILDIRLSLYEGLHDDLYEIEYKARLVEILKKLGFKIISFSNGFYNINKYMIYPPKNEKIVILNDVLNFAINNVDVVLNVSGNMEQILVSTIDLPPNLTFSLGRQLLADPDTIIKLKHNRRDEIKSCSECNACHYYSYGFHGIRNCENS